MNPRSDYERRAQVFLNKKESRVIDVAIIEATMTGTSRLSTHYWSDELLRRIAASGEAWLREYTPDIPDEDGEPRTEFTVADLFAWADDEGLRGEMDDRGLTDLEVQIFRCAGGHIPELDFDHVLFRAPATPDDDGFVEVKAKDCVIDVIPAPKHNDFNRYDVRASFGSIVGICRSGPTAFDEAAFVESPPYWDCRDRAISEVNHQLREIQRNLANVKEKP